MGYWLGVISSEQYADESLYARSTCTVRGIAADLAAGDRVVVASAGGPAILFAIGVVEGWIPSGVVDQAGPAGDAVVRYQRRLAGAEARAEAEAGLVEAGVGELGLGELGLGELGLAASPGLWPLTQAQYERLARAVPAGVVHPRTEWFVTVALPIEAASAADAVREFWTHIEKLGPRELPAFVWPRGDELAMQAYVLGHEANLDPEDDGDG